MKLALFDVDETLLTFNSMSHFLGYFFIEYYGYTVGNKLLVDYEIFIKNYRDRVSRENLNKIYYKNFKGVSRSILSDIGRKWFDRNVRDNEEGFNKSVLNKLENHKKNDCLIVLVSGGFFASLEPLSNYLNVDLLLCITPSESKGHLTGDIEGIQTIGKGKSCAIKNYFKNHVIDWSNSYAYGDHISDLCMLELTGNPVVVGDNQELLKIANANNWQHIIN